MGSGIGVVAFSHSQQLLTDGSLDMGVATPIYWGKRGGALSGRGGQDRGFAIRGQGAGSDTMRAKPVKRSRAPAYPTRAEFSAREGLLGSPLPRGWRVGKRLAGAVTFLAAANLTGCGDSPVNPFVERPAGVQTAADRSTARSRAIPTEAAAVVAPIFEHGEGRGATGCVVISPPVFLSEEEALQVIREELARHGIELATEGNVETVSVMPRVHWPDTDAQLTSVLDDMPPPRPLTMDGVDEPNKVAVKFISREDCERLPWDDYSFGFVEEYDTKGLARYVAEQIKEGGRQRLYAGVFYDPLVDVEFDFDEWLGDEDVEEETPEQWEAAYQKIRSRSAAKAKHLLRRQAEDFVAWLGRQGVL